MDRATAAARAVRVAESKGHTMGEWGAGDVPEAAQCERCDCFVFLNSVTKGGVIRYTYGGNATYYTCKPAGEYKGPFHTRED